MNDNLYEPGNEQFRLVLNHPRTETGLSAMVGDLNETTINVCDEGDSEYTIFLLKISAIETMLDFECCISKKTV